VQRLFFYQQQEQNWSKHQYKYKPEIFPKAFWDVLLIINSMKVGRISQKWWFSSPGEGGFCGFSNMSFQGIGMIYLFQHGLSAFRLSWVPIFFFG
jgi:hypothetical protein